MSKTTFGITTPHIKLDSLLKGAALVGTGGEAKMVIAEGLVRVNGQPEVRRGRKLFPGDLVDFEGYEIRVERAE